MEQKKEKSSKRSAGGLTMDDLAKVTGLSKMTVSRKKTTSSPFGRDVKTSGQPMHMAELLAGLPGTAFSARRSLHDAKHILQAKKAIKIAIKVQMAGLGFSVVELLSSCPTNWGMSSDEALRWVEEEMVPVYPLGDYKVIPEVQALTKRGRKRA